MLDDRFRVVKSATGYRVEMCRGGEPYVTFVDGLSKKGVEIEARSLAAFWDKISKRQPALFSSAGPVQTP